MAVVTVDQTTVVETSAFRPVIYGVQSTFAANSITAAEKNAAADLMAQAPSMDALVWHWSGGYDFNAAGSSQVWAQNDFAPSTSTRIYTDSGGSRRGMDRTVANLDILRARGALAGNTALANAGMVFVMFDHPGSMAAGTTRSMPGGWVPWPAPSMWNGASGHAYDLADEIIARYGVAKIKAFSYGQEMKGLASWTDTAELQNFIDGFETFAALMRVGHPTVELWFPHVALWAYNDAAGRATHIDNLINTTATTFTPGGNSFNDTEINYLMANVNPAYVDRWTSDTSIILNDASPNAWRGTYSAVESRLSLEAHVARVTRLKMDTYWGLRKPIVSIESYSDTNMSLQDWMSDAQLAAAGAGIAANSLKAGITHHARWDPQQDTPGSVSPTGNLQSWFTFDGTVLPAWTQMSALVNAFPIGTSLYSVSSNDTHITAVAGGTKVFLLNTSGSSVSVSVTATNGSLSAQSIPAYSHLVQTLPSGSSATASIAAGTGAAQAATITTRRARLTLRF